MKIAVPIALGVLAVAQLASPARAQGAPAAEAPPRIALKAPADVAAEYRERMKSALAAQPRILSAILAKEFAKAGTIASDNFGAGMVAAKGQPKMAALLPEEVRGLSRAMQSGAEEFAALSRKADVTQQEMLVAFAEKVLTRCSACHAVTRLEVLALGAATLHARPDSTPPLAASSGGTVDPADLSALALALSGAAVQRAR